jgi:hypothetical protein
VVLVWIGAEEGTPAIERWHDVAGYGIVVLVFVGSLILATILGRPKTEVRGQRSQVRDHRSENLYSSFVIRHSSFLMTAALVWLVVVELAAASWYRAHEQNEIAMPRWSVRWPSGAPGFRELKVDEGVRSTLRYDEAKQAAWNLQLQKSADATANTSAIARCVSFFFRWQPGGSSVVRARAHRPDICLPAAGWRQIADRGAKNYQIGTDLVLRFHHLVFTDERGGVTADTFFCLQEDELRPNEPRPDLQVSGGAQPDWSFAARSQVVFNGVRNRGQQIIEVVLLSHGPPDDTRTEKEFAEVIPAIVTIDNR